MFKKLSDVFRRNHFAPDVYKELRARIKRGDIGRGGAGNHSGAPPGWDPLLTDATLSGWFNRSKRELFRGFHIGTQDTLLDIGCGDGSYAHFCGLMGANIILADSDTSNLLSARERLLQSLDVDKVSCVLTTGTALPFLGACVNRVLALEVLEHLEEPEALLGEIVRVGEPGAVYLISVPDPLAEDMQKDIAPDYVFEEPNHINIFRREEFDRMLENAGLVIERKEYCGFFWSVWWLMFWSTGSNLGDASPDICESWTRTWGMLLRESRGRAVKNMLDDLLPKSQIVVARKPSSD